MHNVKKIVVLLPAKPSMPGTGNIAETGNDLLELSCDRKSVACIENHFLTGVFDLAVCDGSLVRTPAKPGVLADETRTCIKRVGK